MRWLLIVLCLSGCTSLGYPAGTVTMDGTELRFEDGAMTVQAVGDLDDWTAFSFSADPPIRLSAQGQTATVGATDSTPLNGPIIVGQSAGLCNLEGPGYSIIVLSSPVGGSARFNLELPAC